MKVGEILWCVEDAIKSNDSRGRQHYLFENLMLHPNNLQTSNDRDGVDYEAGRKGGMSPNNAQMVLMAN